MDDIKSANYYAGLLTATKILTSKTASIDKQGFAEIVDVVVEYLEMIAEGEQ